MSHKPTVEELQTVMGRTFNASQAAAASVLIDLAEMRVQHHIRRPFHSGSATGEVHVLTAGQTDVFLINSPVVSLDALTITAPDYSIQTVLDPNNYTWYRWGFGGLGNSGEGELATVDYTYDGLTEHEDMMVFGVILSAATRWMSRVLADAFGLHAMSTEGSSYTWEKDDNALVLNKADKDALGRVRRRTGVG